MNGLSNFGAFQGVARVRIGFMKDQGLFVVLRKVKIVERIGARCCTTQISCQIGCMNRLVY